MPLIIAIVAVAAVVWWAVFASRGSLLVGCAAFIAASYVLSPDLFSVDIGPIAITADRVLLVALLAAFAWQWRTGQAMLRPVSGIDWILLALVGYLTVRCVFTSPPDVPRAGAGAWWRIASAVWAPTALYAVAKNADLNERSWRRLLIVLTALGGYLAFTAVAEVTEQWWAVFPKHIADPDLGTHFGRARGPALMSASLGVFLTVCGWAAWMLWTRVGRPQQLLLVGLMGIMASGVFFTYTRSTWLGLVGGAMVVPMLQWGPKWRRVLGVGIVLAGLIGLATFGGKVADLGRDDTDGSAEHSVYQRASFAYVSMQMFRDAPLFGCGVGRFYDCKLPYLSDRSQQIELESLRRLDHHNTLLSLLTETGFVGLALFLAVLFAWSRAAWRLYRSEKHEQWVRAHGIFALAVMIAYLASALFHDLTLSPPEHWLLFLSAGVTAGLAAQPQSAAARREVRSDALSTLSTSALVGAR